MRLSSPDAANLARQLESTELLPQAGAEDPAAHALAPGTELDGYVIERVLGSGGGGIVYAACDSKTGQRVAIKTLRADMARHPAMVTRFVREAEAVRKIAHPNIVEIHGMFEMELGRPYYVMELLEGMDLRTHLHLHGRFSPRDALALLEPVCRAVQAAHEAGIIHRDIKANNVMIADVEGRQVVKLLDFGIAKLVQSESAGMGLTEPGAKLGTAHNMAPEQIRCERVDARADIYALGVLLYQLVTGEYPFNASDPRQIALMHLQTPPPRPSALAPVGAAIDAVVLRCLEKQAERRFASALELLAALSSAVGELGEEPAETLAPAVAVYFELNTGDDDGELDDALFDDVGSVLDSIEQELLGQAFQLPLHTSSALLGVRVERDDSEAARAREVVEARIRALMEALAARPDPHPGVTLGASVTTGRVLTRASPQGTEIVGGPLLDVDAWTTENRLR